MLGGRVDHTIDDKNRIRIPAAYLDAFPEGEQLYFVEYATGCISIMPESVKNRRIGSEEDFDPDDEAMMDAMRTIYASVTPVEMDNQKRVKVPRYFKDLAGLKKDIVTVGFMDFIEVWDRERYEAKRAQMTIKRANEIYYKRRREGNSVRKEEDE